MFYIVTKDGHKIEVDSTELKQVKNLLCMQNVVLYDDEDVILQDVWLLSLERRSNMRFSDPEYEFVKEVFFNHEPSKEEILQAMISNGMMLWDFAGVRKGYRLERGWHE